MCAGSGISALGALIHGLGLVYVWKRGNNSAYWHFCGYYMLMEILQWFQWLTLESEFWNPVLTVVALLLVWLQPVLWSFWADQPVLKYLSVITCIYVMMSLGLANTATYSLPGTNYGATTHTDVGIYGHLSWCWKVRTIQYQPTHYVFMMLWLASIAYLPSELQKTLG